MNAQTLSVYILQALARAQSEAKASNLETLTEDLRIRRTDVRHAITALHHQGFVDAIRMRLTLRGFAIGRSLLDRELPPLRNEFTKDSPPGELCSALDVPARSTIVAA